MKATASPRGALGRKLAAARRRVNAIRFFRVLPATATAWAVAALALVGADKLWHWQLPLAGVLGGACFAGLATAAVWAFATRRSTLDAAMDVDSAFGLRERVSTLMSLPEQERGSPAAVALEADVERRTRDIDVAEKIPLRMPRHSWLPIAPLAAAAAVGYLVGPLDWVKPPAAQATATANERATVERQTEVLAKKLEERRKALEEKKASPASEELKELNAKVEKATRDLAQDKKAGAKEAMLKLSDLSKTIEERRKKFGSVEEMQKALGRMAVGMDGPGRELSQALKKGDFQKAAQEMQQIAQKLKDGKMGAGEREKLAENLKKIQQQLQAVANQEKRAEQLQKSGLDKDTIKKELAKIAQDAEQMKKLQQLAKTLGECAKCNNPGDKGKQGDKGEGGKKGDKDGKGEVDKKDGKGKGKEDGKQGGGQGMSEDLQKSLAEAQEALEELAKDDDAKQMLDEMLSDLGSCKNGMGDGESSNTMKQGPGTGRGRGAGDRDEANDDKVRTREKRANVKMGKGQAYIVGQVEGHNIKGQTFLPADATVRVEAKKAADEAISRQKVPRDYREHTKEYFERLNKPSE